MEKTRRQFAVREIISRQVVTSQDDLRVALKKKGIDVTQATLSRDLKELGASWVVTGDTGRYVFQPAAAEAQILRPIVGSQVVSLNANESMIVIHTLPGCAGSVAEFIDSHQLEDIIGTIAGDNTLLIIPRTQKRIKHLVSILRTKLTEGAV
ncbi:MAG TPA: arginine repressor [Bacteroidota bacterium]|nr:arginine repressor [Bacteroidota bacterium]